MKKMSLFMAMISLSLVSASLYAQSTTAYTAQGKNSKSTTHIPESNNLYLDKHVMGPGKVNYAAVANAHAKDLAVQDKYGVQFLNYWVDEASGTIYCLASSPDTISIYKAHGEAHGLLPEKVYKVTEGKKAEFTDEKNLFLDVHELGAGNVTAAAAAGAHAKDLATQSKYGVNFIDYWVDEKQGVVICLAQAKDSTDIIKTHREAHGLIPAYIQKVQQGQ
jgi:phenolic acid decarboxylase